MLISYLSTYSYLASDRPAEAWMESCEGSSHTSKEYESLPLGPTRTFPCGCLLSSGIVGWFKSGRVPGGLRRCYIVFSIYFRMPAAQLLIQSFVQASYQRPLHPKGEGEITQIWERTHCSLFLQIQSTTLIIPKIVSVSIIKAIIRNTVFCLYHVHCPSQWWCMENSLSPPSLHMKEAVWRGGWHDCVIQTDNRAEFDTKTWMRHLHYQVRIEKEKLWPWCKLYPCLRLGILVLFKKPTDTV